MRKHLWKYHDSWMRTRIKRGRQRAAGGVENPAWLPMLLKGIAAASTVANLYGALRHRPQVQRYAARAKVANEAVKILTEQLS